MPLFVNSSGWKTVKNIFVNQSGNWLNIKNGWINQNGIWRQFYASVPGAPTINSITIPSYPDNVAADYFTVNFTPPTQNNTDITSYQYSLNGGGYVTVGTSTSFNVTGLTPGTSYSVVLRAVNSSGAGPNSNTVSATPAGRPFAPSITGGSSNASGCPSTQVGANLTASATANNNGSTLTMQYNTGSSWVNGSSWSSGRICASRCSGQISRNISFRAFNAYGTGPTSSTSIVYYWPSPC